MEGGPGLENGHNESFILSRQEGYDYEFVPALDPKYECAICLLGLRAPIQTTCGHRFCKDCIYNSMSESSSRCPIDNTPLKESDLFPDSCAEREVLQLRVKCPNHTLGCLRVLDLMYVDNHSQACSFQPVLCPNECSATVLQKDLEQHLSAECQLRLKLCCLCDTPYPFSEEQLHQVTCAQVLVGCEMCGGVVTRGELPTHMGDSCPKMVVACPFAEHGCHHKTTRADLDVHMNQSTQYHLHLLSSAFKRVATLVWDLSRSVGIIQSPAGSFSRQPSLRSQVSTSSPIPEEHPSPGHPERTLEKTLCGAGVGDKFPSPPPEPTDPHKLHLHLSHMNVGAEGSSKGGSKGPLSGVSQHQQEVILRDLCEKSVELSQGLMQENISLSNLARRVEEVEAQVEAELGEAAEGRLCNGEFVWVLKDFPRLVQELREHPARVCHSPGFYTSPFGYKFCLRLNLTRQGEQEWVSLYIHTMRGNHDHFLDWPFSGTITLALLDCGCSQPKAHLVETMKSNPNRQAFSRPQTHRNLKGFGFTEFALLKSILNSGGKAAYLQEGALSIRAVVVPGKHPASSPTCICQHQKGQKQ